MPFMSSSVTRDPHCRLIVVCVLFGVLSLTVVRPGLPLGWDELVYASRFTPYGPETPFSAPRTRGVPLLIAPVAAFTDSVAALRCYLTVTASLALYLGYRPWLRVFQERGPQPEPSGRSEGAGGTGGVGGVVPLAAGFYGSVWFALFYAGSAMPNHYVAMGLAAAVGCFVRADLTTSTSSTPSTSRTSRTPTSRLCAGIGAGLAVAALMRPNDAVWPALALLAVALWAVARSGERGRPRGRWAWIAGAVAAGPALALVPWIVEAQLRFGGVPARVRAASEVQGGMRPAFSLPAHAAALDGPLLCRPCGGTPVGWASVAWWLLIPPLVALGVHAARARGRTRQAVLPLVAGLAVAVPYLFFMSYAAPRFLLPAYALLAPVAALGGCALAPRVRRTPRLRPLRPLAAAAVALQLGFQLYQLELHSGIQAAAREDWRRLDRLLSAHGVRPPCVLSGNSSAVPVAHTAGCRPADATAAHPPSALILRGHPLPAWAARAGWRLHPVPGTYNPGWRVALPPAGVTGSTGRWPAAGLRWPG